MAQPVISDQISEREMTRFVDLIYKVTGIRVSLQKKTLLSNRIRRRLKQSGVESFEAYYQKLKKLPPSDAEWHRFLEEITTHETFMFRDQAQWDWFQREFVPNLTAPVVARGGTKSIRVWSAACSTGDEAMTIACCLAGTLPNLAEWRVQIVGTDIGVGALEQAKKAVYGERSMHLVPERFKKRFFTRRDDGVSWAANPVLTGMVSYRQHNLLDALREQPFDIVFLKNVLIYFDDASKRVAMEHVRKLVRPGGLLVAGAAEGVADQLRDMERLQPWLFRAPEGRDVRK